MPMKTSAGGSWFVAVLFLLAGWGTMGAAQDAVEPAVAETSAATEEVLSEPVPEPTDAPSMPARVQDPSLAAIAAMRAASASAESAAAESAPAAAAPQPRPSPDERRAALQDADLAALRAAQDDCLKAAEEITTYVPELHKQMRQAYEDARQNDPAIQDLNRQVAELEARREELLANHPTVLERRRAIDQAQQDMLAELRLRTELDGRITAQESAGAALAEPAE